MTEPKKDTWTELGQPRLITYYGRGRVPTPNGVAAEVLRSGFNGMTLVDPRTRAVIASMGGTAKIWATVTEGQ